MKGRTFIGCIFVVAILGMAIPAWANVLNMSDPNLTSLEFVTVDDANNPPDLRYSGKGAVSYSYDIGEFEVTGGQYCEFLKAVAATDTHDLYSASMSGARGACMIQQNGSPGSYTYSVDLNHANRPVNYVCFWDACRFVNWLTNGQPTGSQDANTTEDGSYCLNGQTGTDGRTIQRKTQRGRYFVPSENEWYKTAYYDPGKAGGAGYWDFPTLGNTAPTAELPPGSAEPNGSANYNAVDQANGITEVGAYDQSPSAYATFDQGGNVQEWDETIVNLGLGWASRQLLGGGFLSTGPDLRANASSNHFPNFEDEDIGFRVVEVPEPATLSLLAIGGLVVLRRGSGLVLRRRK